MNVILGFDVRVYADLLIIFVVLICAPRIVGFLLDDIGFVIFYLKF